MDATYVTAKITKLKATIDLYEDAIDALIGTNAVQAYSLDTGQTKQTVTRANLKDLQASLDSLYNRLAVFQQRATGSGTFFAGGAW